MQDLVATVDVTHTCVVSYQDLQSNSESLACSEDTNAGCSNKESPPPWLTHSKSVVEQLMDSFVAQAVARLKPLRLCGCAPWRNHPCVKAMERGRTHAKLVAQRLLPAAILEVETQPWHCRGILCELPFVLIRRDKDHLRSTQGHTSILKHVLLVMALKMNAVGRAKWPSAGLFSSIATHTGWNIIVGTLKQRDGKGTGPLAGSGPRTLCSLHAARCTSSPAHRRPGRGCTESTDGLALSSERVPPRIARAPESRPTG